MARFSRDFAHPEQILKNCSNGKTVLFQWPTDFFSDPPRRHQRSKVIPDKRGTGKVIPMKNKEIRKICSGCLARYFKKYLEWIFRPKSLKNLAIGKRHKKLIFEKKIFQIVLQQIVRICFLILIAVVSLVSSNYATGSKREKELLGQSGIDVERAPFHWCNHWDYTSSNSNNNMLYFSQYLVLKSKLIIVHAYFTITSYLLE